MCSDAEYGDRGESHHSQWSRPLGVETGNTSALKGVGKGVAEVRIDFGPGLRVYIGQDGADFVILLGGGTKARQQQAIADAHACWADYKARKRRGL